ncbi:MAG TPA: FAD-dependent oxidoreductase [Bryobacterales bacterium]|nr:FAD-dependent oxidoreductase [Bryobacterales bacterium]
MKRRTSLGMRRRKSAVVVGAGAFGGWTALHLLRQGVWVMLVDAWGPGNSRASSGGETRILRATYGPDRVYVEMARRSLDLWRAHEEKWSRRLYHQISVLWMAPQDDHYERAALPVLRETGVDVEELTAKEAAARYPQINFEGVKWAILERDAGYLSAREACRAVLEGFLVEGGEYRQLLARPGAIRGGEMQEVVLSDGSSLVADAYVFACGPWLGQLFPQAVGDRIVPTRQEVFFFGAPAGDDRFSEGRLPVWIDHGQPMMYGIPNARGFKLADDTRGDCFDPTGGDRVVRTESIAAARKYLAFRFPALKDAPLIESRVCQYENSPDHDFIIDRHPQAGNVWIAGGGSGHAFKHGPAVGERVADLVLERAKVDPLFGLARFSPGFSGAAAPHLNHV